MTWYMCSNCRTSYEDDPQRYGAPIPHPKEQCLPLVREHVVQAKKALAEAEQRLARTEAEVYA